MATSRHLLENQGSTFPVRKVQDSNMGGFFFADNHCSNQFYKSYDGDPRGAKVWRKCFLCLPKNLYFMAPPPRSCRMVEGVPVEWEEAGSETKSTSG